MRTFVSKRLAHRVLDARYDAVIFAEVHSALDKLGHLVKRYFASC